MEGNDLSGDDAEVSRASDYFIGRRELSQRWSLERDRILPRGIWQVDDVTALKESKANAEYTNLPYPFRETRLIVAVDVSLLRVVDLTASDTLKALDVTEEELHTEDWRKVQEQGFESLTQALGRAVFEARGEGLLAFSARVAKAINVAYFPHNKVRGSEVRLCQAQELRSRGLE